MSVKERSKPLLCRQLELLIQAIRDQPCLYNPRDSDYKCRMVKDGAWTNAGIAAGITGERARRHWKSLRDVYTKERIKPNSKWKYLKKMSFLADFISSRKSRDGLVDDDYDGETMDQTDVEYKFRQNDDEADGESLDQSEAEYKFSPADFEANHNFSDKRGSSNHFSSIGQVTSTLVPSVSGKHGVPNFCNKNVDSEPDASFNGTSGRAGTLPEAIKNLRDEDLYGLSVAWTLKRFSPRKRAFAKMKIQQLLFEIEFGEDQND